MTPPSPPPMPELIPDAITEILLRLPPADPAGLVRASAVCKPWLRTLTDPAFVRRYRAFHGTSRVLGFLHNPTDTGLGHFVPTTEFRPHAAAAGGHRTCTVLDCRHGRVLFYDSGSTEFVVWDPVTGREHRIPDKTLGVYTSHAVLCAAGAGCDHSTCGGGPFLLAKVGLHCDPVYEEITGVHCCIAYSCFYSSETGETSELTFLALECEHNQCSIEDRPTAIVGGALYYFITGSGALLRYDVHGGSGLSLMEVPPAASYFRSSGSSTIVMTASDSGLGLATFHRGILVWWSTETDPNGDAKWVLNDIIHLGMLLPVDFRMSTAWLSGFAEDANFIFLSIDDNGIFTIELESLLTRKVCEIGNVKHVFPYVTFYTPAAFARGTLQSPMETN